VRPILQIFEQKQIEGFLATFATGLLNKGCQDLRTWVIFITKCTRQVVIATARNAAGSNPEHLKVMINMDCLVGCADAQ
jgi:hypothetical protein